MGGLVVGVREGIEMRREEEEKEEGGIIVGKVRLGREWWRVVGVYVNGDIEEKLERMKKWMEEGEGEEKTIIGGD
ncbi:hypothetical protein EAI_04480 [Harpegnathos saltator]|uniref:Uncharacterized protein n=1 Tax=Harpegnathos saltator TaxID=610380 RepID=E2BBV8_HARSA|nr:hypothetical protein EAI_04480 [Harpegnathos saltator]